MAKKSQLGNILSKKDFSEIDKVFHKHFKFQLETIDFRASQVSELSNKECCPAFCREVCRTTVGQKRCSREHLRSLKIAADTGQSYISLCHAGIVLVCVPIMDKEKALGGMLFGKCLWEPVSESLLEDVEKRLEGINYDKGKILDGLEELQVVTGKQINTASEFLFDLLYEVAGFDAKTVRWRRQRTEQQSQIGEFIQEKKKLNSEWQYPLDSERELMGKVKIGDKTGAKEILNSILGTILFRNPGELGILKVRLLELLSILSRAAVEGGLDVSLVLEKNLGYINKVMHIDNQEDLCVWISLALNDFIESVYTSQDAKKITQIRPAINFIDANFAKPITLAEIAKASHLSVSRLAHLFKEQLGITIIEYLTTVRIERAKELLLATDQNCTEICFEVGYNNQSYFTRTFKDLVGMTPRQFRVKNQRKDKVAMPFKG